MKSAQLDNGDGEPIKEVVIILDPWEAEILAKALNEYASQNKRSKKIQKFSEAFENAPIFF